MSIAVEDAALRGWMNKGQTMTLHGHSIFYIDEGDRNLPALLFIHGFPTASWDWSALWPDLVQHYRLVCLDMLGFGFSDKPNRRDYTIHKQADIVESLVTALNVKRFSVIAHDYGDTVAQELLSRQIDGNGAGQWLSCTFLNGGLFPETHRALITQKILLSPLGPLANRLAGKAKFDASFRKVFGPHTQPTKEELQQFWTLINIKQGKHIFHNLITYMNDRKTHRERWVSALQHSPIPLCLINGSTDPISGEHMVARYQSLACRLDYLAQLEGIGHYPQVEAPEQVLAHLRIFLTTRIDTQ